MPTVKSTGLALSITLPILATVAVGLRFYVRRFKKAQFGSDDYTILIAVVSPLLAPMQHGDRSRIVHTDLIHWAIRDSFSRQVYFYLHLEEGVCDGLNKAL